MVKITVGVDGMVCGMCEAHINEAVRNAFLVKKVTSGKLKSGKWKKILIKEPALTRFVSCQDTTPLKKCSIMTR